MSKGYFSKTSEAEKKEKEEGIKKAPFNHLLMIDS